jgi:hypothetical protein
MSSEYLKRLDVQGHLEVKAALRKWDPIGVFDENGNGPQDEYDSYSYHIVSLLDARAEKKEIVEYLREICEVHIELPFDRKKTEKIIDNLLIFWPTWKAKLKAQNTE